MSVFRKSCYAFSSIFHNIIQSGNKKLFLFSFLDLLLDYERIHTPQELRQSH
jgi:hypothetical protein